MATKSNQVPTVNNQGNCINKQQRTEINARERLPSDEINRSNPQGSDSEECVDDSDDDRIHVKALRFDSQPLPGFSGPTHPFSRNIAADS
ncbi:hypothetical protein Trydic_g14425 [Trypoxylus dichotomus]